jgi:hypothetical protein
MDMLFVVILLAVTVHQLVNLLVRPLKVLVAPRQKGADGKSVPLTAADIIGVVTPWAAFAVGGAICWFGTLDLYNSFMPAAPGWITRGLTSALVGGGAELIHEVAKAFRKYKDVIGALAPELKTVTPHD